ncbi:MAG: glycoside hydrolase family 2, partial [Lentisphaerae bacterium]|nr:glycoside hydrolase family 2 [Lentisphaerota bacterium]
RTIGLRRTDVTTEEEPGEFVFVVNGVKVFAKGTNWVPLDALHSRDTDHLPKALEMLADLNCNMIRCWGGNVYEHDQFYDFCDANGIMVWQDFSMACAYYPQTDAFADQIATEAAAVVKRLRNHASLALWAGNNENDSMCCRDRDPNEDRISRQVLKDIVRRLDPHREYLPSSPYISPELVSRGCKRDLWPEDHLWRRADYKDPFYTDSRAHFLSEIGYHGCPVRESLEEMFDPEFVWPWQNNIQWLTKAVRPFPNGESYTYRIELMAEKIETVFGTVPDSLDDYVLASQIAQAEAFKFFIEYWRQAKWRRTGILWWNLRDGWPILSDAVVDYYNRPKLAYQYIKRSQTDVCAIVAEPVDGLHRLVVTNDTRRPVIGNARVADADTGEVIAEAAFSVSANGIATVAEIPQATGNGMWLTETRLKDGCVLRNHYVTGELPMDLGDYKRWLDGMGIVRG